MVAGVLLLLLLDGTTAVWVMTTLAGALGLHESCSLVEEMTFFSFSFSFSLLCLSLFSLSFSFVLVEAEGGAVGVPLIFALSDENAVVTEATEDELFAVGVDTVIALTDGCGSSFVKERQCKCNNLTSA